MVDFGSDPNGSFLMMQSPDGEDASIYYWVGE